MGDTEHVDNARKFGPLGNDDLTSLNRSTEPQPTGPPTGSISAYSPRTSAGSVAKRHAPRGGVLLCILAVAGFLFFRWNAQQDADKRACADLHTMEAAAVSDNLVAFESAGRSLSNDAVEYWPFSSQMHSEFAAIEQSARLGTMESTVSALIEAELVCHEKGM